jgi:hypothetical protein
MIDLDLSFFGFETEAKLLEMIGHDIEFMDRRVEIEENNVFVSFESLNDFLGHLQSLIINLATNLLINN